MSATLTTIALLACVCASAFAQTKPDFCKTYDCPLFTSDTSGGFELRTYVSANNWVSTSTVTNSARLGWMDQSRMFRKLFSYINGGKSDNLRIDMTVPVPTRYEELPGGGVKITMSFYLAMSSPPTPDDADVVLVQDAANKQYLVRSFNTNIWATDGAYNRNLNALKRAVGQSVNYKANVHCRVGYDSPMTFFDRHHEIWLELE